MGQGIAMGLNNSFMSLGRVVGPLTAGMLFDLDLRLPYLSGALATLIGFLLCVAILRPIPQPGVLQPEAKKAARE
jgi:DHA1 family multidrug resistance protein-like MFS transporter